MISLVPSTADHLQQNEVGCIYNLICRSLDPQYAVGGRCIDEAEEYTRRFRFSPRMPP